MMRIMRILQCRMTTITKTTKVTIPCRMKSILSQELHITMVMTKMRRICRTRRLIKSTMISVGCRTAVEPSPKQGDKKSMAT